MDKFYGIRVRFKDTRGDESDPFFLAVSFIRLNSDVARS